MYKSKLQEVCHQKRWGLPKYVCLKDGPDHNPQFRASVCVNGTAFDSPIVSNSSKHAHNEAAKLAYLHFTADNGRTIEKLDVDEKRNSPEISDSSSIDVDCSSPSIEDAGEESETKEVLKNPRQQSSVLHAKHDFPSHHKMNLQNHAQRKNLDSPLYSSKMEGPPHAPCFRATVTINGQSFESPGSFKTLREAEHAAARAACMTLALDAFDENDLQPYKNILQELAQNEGLMLPRYVTIGTGKPHSLTFFSTVEMEGEIFRGSAGKSKKLAELNAAKAAYATLMDRKLSRSGEYMPSPSNNEAHGVPPCLNLSSADISQGNPKPACPLAPTSTDEVKVVEERDSSNPEIKEAHHTAKLHSNAVSSSHDMQSHHKMNLLNSAHRNNLDLPLYSYRRDGPPQAPCFRAIVNIGEQSFESPGAFKTLKEAEHSAARTALMELSLEASKEEDYAHYYKNLLVQLAQSEGFVLPTYKTMRCGEPHKPAFFSTVEVGGEIFCGNAAKSKKQADLDAAKVAYNAFMERKSCFNEESSESSSDDKDQKITPFSGSITASTGEHNLQIKCSLDSSPKLEIMATNSQGESPKPGECSESSSDDEILKVPPRVGSFAAANVQPTLQSGGHPASSPKFDMKVKHSQGEACQTGENSESCSDDDVPKVPPRIGSFASSPKSEMKAKPRQDVVGEALSTDSSPSVVNASLQKSISSPDIPKAAETLRNRGRHPSLESQSSLLEEFQPSSAAMARPDLSILSIAGSSGMKKTAEAQSYLLNNRVRVYTSIPDIAFPKGTVVVPFCEDKWIAASLEFPNEKYA